MKYLRTLTVFLLLAIHTCTPDEMASASHCPDSVCFCRVLDTADCSYRNLSNIPRGLPASIRYLVMSGNPLYSLSDDFFRPVENLTLKKLWYENNMNRTSGNASLYTCNTPIQWRGVPLVDFDTADCQEMIQYVVMALIIAGVLFLVALSFIVVRRYSWDIKYYIHACKYNKLTSPPENLRDDFLYDGFVAYNTRDRKWIMAELVEHVERKHKYKLCLHERDIIPSGVYVEDVLESIDFSRTLILVPTKNFMDDQ